MKTRFVLDAGHQEKVLKNFPSAQFGETFDPRPHSSKWSGGDSFYDVTPLSKGLEVFLKEDVSKTKLVKTLGKKCWVRGYRKLNL